MSKSEHTMTKSTSRNNNDDNNNDNDERIIVNNNYNGRSISRTFTSPYSTMWKAFSSTIILWCSRNSVSAFAPGIVRSPSATVDVSRHYDYHHHEFTRRTSGGGGGTIDRSVMSSEFRTRTWACLALRMIRDDEDGNDDTNSTAISFSEAQRRKDDGGGGDGDDNDDLLRRLVQLERLASAQAVEIKRLKAECRELKDAAVAFGRVVELLRRAGLSDDPSSSSSEDASAEAPPTPPPRRREETDDDARDVFGAAPASVIEAADSAGAAVLAAVLGGKLRMSVDVRDAELTRDPDVLVEFLELAVLPVAAGLEGIARVKIVFPTVSQLLTYRKSMALAAPDVLALSTLGCEHGTTTSTSSDEVNDEDVDEPLVHDKDNLVVIVAPSPDDEEGVRQLNRLLESRSYGERPRPVVVVNHHMVPLSEEVRLRNFEIVYHLRLLSVQYSTEGFPAGGGAGSAESRVKRRTRRASGGAGTGTATEEETTSTDKDVGEPPLEPPATSSSSSSKSPQSSSPPPQSQKNNPSPRPQPTGRRSEEDAALDAAMEHAHGSATNQGSTRAMVIRAYPRPWHVFVDTSPDADVDFEVAATFDAEPSQEEINYAIVECLEGSEREDELVAQQMQEALEAGQLDCISDIMGSLSVDEDDDDDDDLYGDPFYSEDSC